MQSIARTRMIKVLENPLKDYSESTQELIEAVVARDDDGNLIKSGQGLKIQPRKEQEFLDTTRVSRRTLHLVPFYRILEQQTHRRLKL